MCVTNFISIHTSRFGNRIKQIWQPLLFINGYLRMEYTLFQDFARKIPRPAPPTRPRPVRPYTGIWLQALREKVERLHIWLLFVASYFCTLAILICCKNDQRRSSHSVRNNRMHSCRALVRILKLPVIFERVPVQNGLKWFKMG